MGPLATAAVTAGTSLLSGWLGRNQDSGPSLADQYGAAADAQKRLERNRYKWLVSGAKRAGFNPLTVLGATGGQMAGLPSVSVPAAPLSMGSVVGRALVDGANAYLSSDPIAEASDRLDVELKKARLEQIKNENSRQIGTVPVVRETASTVEEGGAEPLGMENSRPKPRPHPENQARVPVYGPAGQSWRLLKNVADRLTINAFHSLTGGDLAEIAGEGAEVTNVLQMDKIAEQLLDSGILSDASRADAKAKREAAKEKRGDRKRERQNRIQNGSDQHWWSLE